MAPKNLPKKIMGFPRPTKKVKCSFIIQSLKDEKSASKGYEKNGIWIAKDENEHFAYLTKLAKDMDCKGIPKK